MALTENISRGRRNKNAEQKVQQAIEFMSEPQRKREALPEFFDKVAGVVRTAIDKRPTSWKADGVDHINIWAYAQTELGRSMETNYLYKFEHPQAGMFISVAAFAQAITMMELDPRVRNMVGQELYRYCQYMNDNYRTINIPNFEQIIVEAMYYRLNSMPGIVQELEQTKHLPLDCYSVNRYTGETSRPFKHRWYVPAMEIIRSAILAGAEPDFTDFAWEGMRDTSPVEAIYKFCPWLAKSAKPEPIKKETVKPMQESKEKTERKKPEKAKPATSQNNTVRNNKKVKQKDPSLMNDEQRQLHDEGKRREIERGIARYQDLQPGDLVCSVQWRFASHAERYDTMSNCHKLGVKEVKDVLVAAGNAEQPDYDESFAYLLIVSIYSKDGQEYLLLSTAEDFPITITEDGVAQTEHEVEQIHIEDGADPIEAVSQTSGVAVKYIRPFRAVRR